MRGLSRAAIFPIFAILTVHWLLASATSQSAGFSADFMAPIQTECTGSIAECSLSNGVGDLFHRVGEEAETAEFEMDSEINRRILATGRYISYGALRRNTIPCSRRGASYYNCRRGAEANPYSRGCSTITRCRR